MYDPKKMDEYIDNAEKLRNGLLRGCHRFNKCSDLPILERVIEAAKAYRATVRYHEGTYDINED